MKNFLLLLIVWVCIFSLSNAIAGTKKYDSLKKTKSLMINSTTPQILKITDYEIRNGSQAQVNTESILNKSVMKEDSIPVSLLEFQYHTNYWITIFSEWKTTGWRPDTKNIIYFDNDINVQDSFVMLTYDTIALKWENSAKFIYFYDNQGKDTAEVIYAYDKSAKNWKPAGRNKNEYNSSGNLIRQTNYSRSNDGNSWILATKFEHTWSGGVETSYEFFIWNQVAWMGFAKTEYVWYNPQQLKSTTTYTYDLMLPGYVKESLTKQTWQNNLQDTVMAFSWENNVWNATWFDKTHYVQGTSKVRSMDTWEIPEDKSASNSVQFVKTGVSVYQYDDSGNTGIDETKLSGISLFPNPAVSEVSLYVSNPENCRVNIFTIHGSLIRSLPVYESFTTIDLHGLTKGTYLFRIEKAPKSTTRLLIKE